MTDIIEINDVQNIVGYRFATVYVRGQVLCTDADNSEDHYTFQMYLDAWRDTQERILKQKPWLSKIRALCVTGFLSPCEAGKWCSDHNIIVL